MTDFSKLMEKLLVVFDPNMWIIGDFYPSSGIILPIAAASCIFLSYYLYKRMTVEMIISLRDATKNHHWRSIRFRAQPWYCSICEALLMNGLGAFCDCCGVCADPDCLSKVNKLYPCKSITSDNEIQLHHWVKGNLPVEAICEVCYEECSAEHGLMDYRCCWCQRNVHEECFSQLPDECDFGPWKNMLVPPWCVQVARRKNGIHKQLLLRGVKDPGWKNWSPLIVVANRKSGSNDDASAVLSDFRKYLNPAQVLDLADRRPAAALQWCILLAPKPVTILVAGGDGTVAWVLTTAYKMNLDPKPVVGILPLGTGNDLARVLGWGKGYSSELKIKDMVHILEEATTSEIDRWKVDVIPNRHLGIRFPMKTKYMYNYLSIGVDAQVTLDFHRTRSSRMYFMQNRFFNKLLYLCFGTQQIVAADCKNLEHRLDLYLDGTLMQLPELESVVILNIQSWGAGVDLWGLNAEAGGQSYKDGVLEVLGIYSSFHIAQLQVGLSTAHRIGQARSVEIHLKGKSPVQLDGEPWEQHPAQIKISLTDTANILINTIPDEL